MAHSMTAFSRVQAQESWGQAIWEIRSVNHRYLDLTFKIPEAFRAFEIQWREKIKSTLSRGKVECYLTYKLSPSQPQALQVQEGMVRTLMDLSKQVESITQHTAPLSTLDILKWPEVIVSQSSHEALKAPVTALLEKALEQLLEQRAKEGKQCLEVIQARVETIKSQVLKAKSQLPQVEQAFRERLETRLGELKSEVDPSRFEQEVLMFLNKIDVSEELDRLNMHMETLEQILNEEKVMGRRLDFLMQELNREANTLASKSPDMALTQVAVEIKVCIEQIREQIQNLE